MAGTAWAQSPSGGEEQDSSLRPRELIMPQKSLESEAEIPTIPDADDLADASSSGGVSSSKISLTKTALYQELDSELLKQNSCFSMDGINLTPLLKFIHPDVNVKENDAAWTIDSLFKDLSEYYENDNKTT